MALTEEQMRLVFTASNETAAAFNALRRQLGGLSSLAGSAGLSLGALGAGLSSAALLSFSRDAVKSLGDIADEADRVGVSTDALQTLQFNLKQSGGDAGDAVAALQKFGVAASKAGQEGNTLAAVLEANGVALRDQNGNLRSSDALLEDYARLVAGAASQQDKLMLATEAFGRNAGPKMVGALEKIANEGLPGMIRQAKEAGQVVDEELIRKADEIDDRWNAAIDSVTNGLKGLVVEAIKAGEAIGKALDQGVRKPGAMAGLMDVEGFVGPDANPAAFKEAEQVSTYWRGMADRDDPLRRRRASPTVIPPPPPGGGGALTAERNRSQEVLEFLRQEGAQLTLNKQERLAAEQAQKQTIMLARAGVDASREEQEQIKGAVAALFEKREAYEELKRQQEAYNDLLSFGGDMLADSIDGLISKTKSWQDVLDHTLRMLQTALIRSALLGEGPLAGVMGTRGVGGNVGGLLGAVAKGFGLPGFASGGSFRVGGAGGTDSQLVAFRASPDETVSVTRPGQGGGGAPRINFVVQNFGGAQVSQPEVRQNADGSIDMQVAVKSIVSREMAQGGFRKAGHPPPPLARR